MSLHGRKFLVTAGPTRAPMDAIRYITNKSTGRLGALLAEEALRRGASVTFAHGRPSVAPTVRGGVHDHLTMIAIDTVQDLIRTLREELPKGYDAVIHNMAVLDFEPAEIRPGKTGSEEPEWMVRLVPTPKAVRLVKELAPKTFLAAFKLEVGKSRDELVASALELLRKNRCDLVVANVVPRPARPSPPRCAIILVVGALALGVLLAPTAGVAAPAVTIATLSAAVWPEPDDPPGLIISR